MIKVSNEVPIYEIDGREANGVGTPTLTLTVASHWNRNSLVVLTLDGKKVTVAARELQAAVTNATNTGR